MEEILLAAAELLSGGSREKVVAECIYCFETISKYTASFFPPLQQRGKTCKLILQDICFSVLFNLKVLSSRSNHSN